MKTSSKWKEYTNFYIIPRGSDGKLINGSYNRIWKSNNYCGAINLTTPIQVGYIKNNLLYYWKLNTKEVLNLMIYNQNQINRIMYKNIISESNLYKLAGNSIVIPVLEHIFKEKMKLSRNEPIKMFEAFAGYGSQHQALKNLGYKVDATISEWYTEAIIAYGLLHEFGEMKYLLEVNENQEFKNHLKNYFIYSPKEYSTDSKKLNTNNLKFYKNKKALYSAEKLVKNIGSIVGKTYKDTPEQFDIATWSFPCQDLSQAGKGAGMGDNTTRSGLCWEFINWLKSMVENKKPPTYLLMENVPAIHNKKNLPDFIKLQEELKEMGYKNEWFDLNAKDFGIPQNRNRTFMVSQWGNNE